MTDRFSRICGRDRVTRARFVLLFALFFMFFIFSGASRVWATDYEFDINLGSITVEKDADQKTVASGGGRVGDAIITANDLIIIKGAASTQNTITVQGGVSVKIKLDGVNISIPLMTTKCAFEITGDSTVDLTLSGSNTLISGPNKAGLQVESGNKLTICGNNTTDELTAIGGNMSAGIGASLLGNGGTIIINGGKVTASSSMGGAGIGGGENGFGGTIAINGGTVNAAGGLNGAGIGCGLTGGGGVVTISGGTVTATGGDGGAGIGGGYGGGGGNIIINGGKVTASSSTGGAGIGGGYTGNGGNIAINGGTVNAEGGDQGAGIGGGFSGGGGTIIINGGTVNATGGDRGAGIGGGLSGFGGTIAINGGTVTATGGTSGMDIGPGELQGGNLGAVTITGGSVHPTNGAAKVSPQPMNAAGIPVPVYLNTLTVGSSSVRNTLITVCTVDGTGGYGINDVYTDGAGNVYFWLPSNPRDGNVTVLAAGKSYGKSYPRNTTSIIETLSFIPTPTNPDSVPVPVTGVTLTMQNMALSVGQTGTLRATITPNSATDKGLIWSSENPEIASVNANGVVSGLMPGTTTITVKTKDGGFTATCTVTVTETGGEIEIDLSALKLDNGILRLLRGQSVDVTITSDPTGAAFTADGLPDGLTISLQGRLSGVPDEPGRWLVVLTATLPDGTTAEAAFIIIVSDTQDNGGSSGGCATGAAGAIAALALAVIVLASRGCRRRSKIRA